MHERLLNVLRDEFTVSSTQSSYAVSAPPAPSVNFRIVMCFAAFLFPYVAFLLILPGIREKRAISFIAISTQLCIGVLLMASLILPYWKVGEARVVTHFRANSNHRHEVDVGVNVGLEAINITMKYIRTVETSERPYRGLYFNEKYDLKGISSMARELQIAYKEGLPYPILKVLEYFSLTQGAFAWGGQYRNAGHFANALLWAAFITWLTQCLILALVPWHFSKLGIVCGVFAILSDIVYVILSPPFDLIIPFPGLTGQTTYLRLHCGPCFYMVLIAGILSIIFGVVLAILQFLRLYTLSTCLSATFDDAVGLKCKWTGHDSALTEWHTEGSSSSSSSTGESASAYTINEEMSVQNQSLNSSTTASTICVGSLESTPATPKRRGTAISAVVSNTLAIANAMSSSPDGAKSQDILRRRTRDKGHTPMNPNQLSTLMDNALQAQTSHLPTAVSELRKNADQESSGFQSRSSLSARNSTSSLDSIPLETLNECNMTDDEDGPTSASA
ncbi:dual oxidase maturation factor domain-containing protein [Ditylenchus destructor]|nr:dual oxidase maturation factor domain-containing protein [Ditylenchus destructor]